MIAAVAVSVGMVPVGVPSAVAFSNSVEQLEDGEEVEEVVFTHAARTSAIVLTCACGEDVEYVTVFGGVPVVVLAGVAPGGMVSAAPVARFARLAALAKAFAIPVCASVAAL